MELSKRHPSVVSIMKFFVSDHLPPHLAPISKASRELAEAMVELLPDSPELVFGLRQLLLAKDAFVRTAQEKHESMAN